MADDCTVPVDRRDKVLPIEHSAFAQSFPVRSVLPSPPREPVGLGGLKFVVPLSGGVFNMDRLMRIPRNNCAVTRAKTSEVPKSVERDCFLGCVSRRNYELLWRHNL